MNIKQKVGILSFGVLLGAAVIGLIWLLLTQPSQRAGHQATSASSSQQISNTHSQQEQLLSNTQAENKRLKAQLDGTALSNLEQTTTQFFKIYYTYDQSKVSNKDRQKTAGTLANQSVLNQMFPLSADGQVSDYGYIKSTLNSCQVYGNATKANEVTALVVTSYTAKAGSMNAKTDNYVWEVTFDNNTKVLTQIKDMGKLSGGMS